MNPVTFGRQGMDIHFGKMRPRRRQERTNPNIEPAAQRRNPSAPDPMNNSKTNPDNDSFGAGILDYQPASVSASAPASDPAGKIMSVKRFIQKLLRLDVPDPTPEDTAFREAETLYAAEKLYEEIRDVDAWDPEINFFREAMKALPSFEDSPRPSVEAVATRNQAIQQASARLFKAKRKDFPLE